MTDLQRQEAIDIRAAARAELTEIARAAVEKSNRSIGQHLRRSLARIEAARREFNK